MVFLLGGILIFLLLLGLVVFYHLFFWDLGFVFGNERCWTSSFECGFVSQRFVENYFSCSFFLLLVFFVVFDLEVSLLLNIPFEGVLYKNFFPYFTFLFCLVFGYIVEVEGGYVSWDF